MTGFIAGAILLLALTFLLLLVPYWRRSRDTADRRQLNAAIYRDEMADLDRDLATGALNEADHRQAKEELQRRLLEDSSGAEAAYAKPAVPKKTLAVLALLLPLAAAGLYLMLGTPAGINPPPEERQFTRADIDRMVAGLAARLEQQPDNVEGWIMLARSYRALRRLDEAASAYAHAVALTGNDPNLLAEYADVIILRTGSFDGKPTELIIRALKLDPDNVQAGWLAGTAAFEHGRYAEAVGFWERALKQLPPGSEDAQALAGSIEEARTKGSLGTGSKTSAADAAAKSVSGRVELAPALKAAAAPTDKVLVFARATSGPRMPIAVLQAKVADLPLNFVLDDSQAMTPEFRISSAQQVVVEARVSKSGQAALQQGDLQASPQTVKVGSKNIRLVVDQVHP